MKKLKVLKKKNENFTNVNLLSELPFFYKKPKALSNKELSEALPFLPKRPKRFKRPKGLTKHQILQNILPFYDSVEISRREHAHRYYAETYDVDVVDNISLNDSLFLGKSSINNLFRDLLTEKRGFKYFKYNLVAIVPLTNQRFDLNSAYEELKLYIWTDLSSGWIIDKTKDINIDIANYDPLAGNSYITLLPELNNSMKGLINLENKDNESFKWCNVRFINPQNKHFDRINKQDKKIASTLDYRGINFPMKARDYEIVEERFNINVNVFGYKNRVFPLYVSKKSNEQVLNVLLISNEGKSHYVFIKDFKRLMYSKTEHKEKNTFVCHVYKILLLRKY